MIRRHIFSLYVHYYPLATEANVEPVEIIRFPQKNHPSFYQSQKFNFYLPPSRQDFLDMCRRWLPWTHVWESNLLSLIEKNICEWPMIDSIHKSATTDIINEKGAKIGHLQIQRESLILGESYDQAEVYTPASDYLNAVKQINKELRHEAHEYLEKHKHRLMERISLQHISHLEILREMLTEGGFFKHAPHIKQTKNT